MDRRSRHLPKSRKQHPLAAVVGFGHIGHHFQGIQRPTRIAIDQFGNRMTCIVWQYYILPAVAPGFVFHRLRQHLLNIFGG